MCVSNKKSASSYFISVITNICVDLITLIVIYNYWNIKYKIYMYKAVLLGANEIIVFLLAEALR